MFCTNYEFSSDAGGRSYADNHECLAYSRAREEAAIQLEDGVMQSDNFYFPHSATE